MEFYEKKDLAMCGLACVLCSCEECPGCKTKCSKEGEGCSVYQCASQKGLDGCYQCDEFPCSQEMHQGVRNRAFNQYARQYGKQALLDRLRDNYRNGITYHKADGSRGDYDTLETEAEVIYLIQFGKSKP